MVKSIWLNLNIYNKNNSNFEYVYDIYLTYYITHYITHYIINRCNHFAFRKNHILCYQLITI